MNATHRAARTTFALALAIASGCSPPPDERLVVVAERSAERQKEQNELLARQSEAVIQENQRIAEAARELVAKDAEARQEMVRAQRELQGALQSEQSGIDEQRAMLDQERREIAKQRLRDPVIAETIRSIGTLIVCLVPLIVAAYALSRMGQAQPESEELAELLVRELAGDNPTLLLSRRPPALEDLPGDLSDDAADSVPNDEPPPNNPPL